MAPGCKVDVKVPQNGTKHGVWKGARSDVERVLEAALKKRTKSNPYTIYNVLDTFGTDALDRF